MEIGLVGLFKIALDVCEIDQKAVAHVFVWPIHSCDGLQKIVVFEFTTEIEALESWGVEPREQHVVDNEHIDRHVLFEVLDELAARFLVFVVVQDEARF